MSKPNELKLRFIQRLTLIVTAATVALNAFRYGGGRLIVAKLAGGQAYTLPFSTGKGGKYRIFVGTTYTSNATIHTAAGNNPKTAAADVISGVSFCAGGSSNGPGFATASNTNTITLNGTTSGGVLGTYIDLEDVAPGQWRVAALLVGSGALVTPFSNS